MNSVLQAIWHSESMREAVKHFSSLWNEASEPQSKNAKKESNFGHQAKKFKEFRLIHNIQVSNNLSFG